MKQFKDKETFFKEKTGKDFLYVYKKYYPKLIHFVLKICGNDLQKAEDITSDSFLIAMEKIDMYDRDKSQISTWLFTIAKNLALQDLKNKNKTISIDNEFDEDGSTMKDFLFSEDDNGAGVLKHIICEKKAEIMKRHIHRLKEPYKRVIIMRELENMSYKEISEKLNLNLSTVKSQIRNGRALLVKQTKKEFDSLDDEFYF